MVIKSIAETSYQGMFKIAAESGAAFFVRQEYLASVELESVLPGEEFSGEQEEQFLDAGLASAVELKAVEYLARAEQSRFGLTRKLTEKKYARQHIDMALDFLEQKNYLSDERFSRAWLNSRRINHFEGRTKLLAELMGRGINKDVACGAIDDFFTENDETEICHCAYKRFVEKGKTDQKLIVAMLNAGFTYKMIKEVSQMFEEVDEMSEEVSQNV
ncbi:MAG: recombination regulator RecX [Treponema sp.]|nr:recombination regulator RecX [Treponema sp.]